MKTLDCETPDATYNSLQAILGVGREELIGLFDSIDPDALYAKHPETDLARGGYLLSLLQKETGCSTDFDATCWFHCTRTWGHGYPDGLLPLSMAGETVWDFLYSLVKDRVTEKQWQTFEEDIVPASELYSVRYEAGKRDDGPYALLVRESARAVAGNYGVDYFELPEHVDNICRGMPGPLGDALRTEYQAHTRPAIVKFRTDCHGSAELEMALYYVYRKHYDLDIGVPCNCCYDGEGRAIPKGDILDVEYIKENPR